MKISIIHPSRQRPQQALNTALKWLRDADKNNIEYILSVDTTDDMLPQYKNLFGGLPIIKIIVNDNRSCMEAVNSGAKESTGDLLIVNSDDFDCCDNWFVLLQSALLGKKDFIVKTDDGCQPWIMTLPMMDRVYYERFGYIYNPAYLHMFADTEMTHVADLIDKKVCVPLLFKHLHYTQKGGQAFDALNRKNDSTWTHGENLYLDRVKNNFYLPKKLIIKKLTEVSQVNWLKAKGVDTQIL